MWDEYRKELEQLHLDDSVKKCIQQNSVKHHPHAYWMQKGKWAFAFVFVACFITGAVILLKQPKETVILHQSKTYKTISKAINMEGLGNIEQFPSDDYGAVIPKTGSGEITKYPIYVQRYSQNLMGEYKKQITKEKKRKLLESYADKLGIIHSDFTEDLASNEDIQLRIREDGTAEVTFLKAKKTNAYVSKEGLLEIAQAMYKNSPKLHFDDPLWKIKIDYVDGILNYQVVVCENKDSMWRKELHNLTFYVSYKTVGNGLYYKLHMTMQTMERLQQKQSYEIINEDEALQQLLRQNYMQVDTDVKYEPKKADIVDIQLQYLDSADKTYRSMQPLVYPIYRFYLKDQQGQLHIADVPALKEKDWRMLEVNVNENK